MDIHHRLDVLLGRFPSFTHERIVKLLRRRVLPYFFLGIRPRDGRRCALRRQLGRLAGRHLMGERRHLVERVEFVGPRCGGGGGGGAIIAAS